MKKTTENPGYHRFYVKINTDSEMEFPYPFKHFFDVILSTIPKICVDTPK